MRNGEGISPTHSLGSAGSDHSIHGSGSSPGSVSNEQFFGIVPYGDAANQGHALQRVEQYPPPNVGQNAVYGYPLGANAAHANSGMGPFMHGPPHHPQRTHTYPLVGPPGVPVSAPFPDQRGLSYSAPNLLHGQIVHEHPRVEHSAPTLLEDDGDYHGDTGIIRSGDDAFIPMSDAELRQFIGLTPDQPLNLTALRDPPVGQRPDHPIPLLSQLAILGSPQKMLTLQGIYAALEDRFEWFRSHQHEKAWQVCRV